MPHRTRFLWLALAVLVMASHRVGAATFLEMSKWVPADANVVVAVDVAKALETPLAKERYWAATLQLRYSEKQTRILPSSEKQLMAASFDSATNRTQWEVLLIDIPAVPSTKDLAAMTGNKAEKINGFDVIPSRQGGYIVRIDNDFVAVRNPGNRQAVTRWIRDSEAPGAGISAYLKESLRTGNGDDTFLVVAADLDGMLSAEKIRAAVGNLRSLKKTDINHDQAAALIAGLKGVVVRAAGTEKLTGTVELDFGQSPALLTPVAGPLALELFTDAGLDLDDVDLKNQSVSVAGNKIIIKGPMTGKNLARLGAMVTVAKPAGLQPESAEPEAKSTDPAVVSKEYFRTVSTFIEEMKRVRNADELETAANYIEKCARKIENVPILNVDADLLKWSEFASISMREATFKLRDALLAGRKETTKNANIRANVDARDYDYASDYLIDYGYMKRRLEHEQTLTRITAKLEGREAARAVLKNLDEETLKVRREMTKKYKVEF